MGERRLAVYPRLPASAAEATPREGAILNDAYIERWTVHAPTGFAGETIAFDGLAESRTDVLVRIERLSGEVSTARMTPANPSFDRAGGYRLATGGRHLCLARRRAHPLWHRPSAVRAGAHPAWRGAGARSPLTVTAFTVAHSITLGAATLGYLNVPGPPVEAAIALSIVLVAVEIVKSRQAGETSLTARFALARRLRVRPSAWARLCRRAERSRPARSCDPGRAAVLQHRGGAGTARLHGGRPGVVRDPAPALDRGSFDRKATRRTPGRGSSPPTASAASPRSG